MEKVGSDPAILKMAILIKSKYLLGYLLINVEKMMLPKDLLRLIQLQIC